MTAVVGELTMQSVGSGTVGGVRLFRTIECSKVDVFISRLDDGAPSLLVFMNSLRKGSLSLALVRQILLMCCLAKVGDLIVKATSIYVVYFANRISSGVKFPCYAMGKIIDFINPYYPISGAVWKCLEASCAHAGKASVENAATSLCWKVRLRTGSPCKRSRLGIIDETFTEEFGSGEQHHLSFVSYGGV